MSTKIDMERIFDRVLKERIADPTTPEDERELAKALLSVSPYYEEYKEETSNQTKDDKKTSSKKRQKQKK